MMANPIEKGDWQRYRYRVRGLGPMKTKAGVEKAFELGHVIFRKEKKIHLRSVTAEVYIYEEKLWILHPREEKP